jgi:hypothetical protein
MEGIKNLDKLLKEMKPILNNKEYVFCTLPRELVAERNLSPLLTFEENEGTTIIIEKKIADANALSYNGVWVLITLTVYSDLSAVGFLARITEKLARSGISVNVVSAYYHDHLFVPSELAGKSIEILNNLSKASQ